MNKYYRLRDRLLPVGTRRRAAAKIFFNLPRFIAPENVRKTLKEARVFGFRRAFEKMKEGLNDSLTCPYSAFPGASAAEELKTLDTRSGNHQIAVWNINSRFLKGERPLKNRRLAPPVDLTDDQERISDIIGKIRTKLLGSYSETLSRE